MHQNENDEVRDDETVYPGGLGLKWRHQKIVVIVAAILSICIILWMSTVLPRAN